MVTPDVSVRKTAAMCLVGAVALLLLVYCTAPVRQPPATATPTYAVTLVIQATLEPLIAGSPTTRTPTVVPERILTPRPTSTPPPVLIILPTPTPEPPTATPVRTMTQKG